MGNKISQILEFDNKGAIKALDEIVTEAGKTESAGKALADALHASADIIEQNLKADREAAEMLGQALGPELAAKVGQNGLEGMVADLKKTGVTSDDIKANVADLAGAIQHLDQVGSSLDGPQKGLQNVKQDLGEVEGAMNKVHGETDQTRSVMANFTGNALQELPGVASAMGPLSMAVGQFGEYSAEGNINFKAMLSAGLAMGAVTVVLQAVTGELAKQKAVDAFNHKQIDDWKKAIMDGKDSVEQLAAAARDAGEIKAFAGFDGVKDLVPQMANLGLTSDQFFAIVKGGKPALGDWIHAMQDAGLSGDDLNDVATGLAQTIANQDKAAAAAEVTMKVLGGTTDSVNASMTNAQTSTQGYSYAVQDVEQSTKDATTAVDEHKRHAQSMADDVKRDLDEISGKWDALSGNIDSDKSLLTLQGSFDDVKQKAKDAFDAAASGADDSEQKIRDAHLATDDLKLSVINYGKEVLGIPPQRVTKMLADIDQGKLDDVEAALNNLARNRTMNIDIVAKGGAGYSTLPKFDKGGTVPGAKNEPVLAIVHGGEKVISNDQQSGQSGFGGVNVYLTVQGSVQTERDLVRSVADGIIDAQRRGEIPTTLISA